MLLTLTITKEQYTGGIKTYQFKNPARICILYRRNQEQQRGHPQAPNSETQTELCTQVPFKRTEMLARNVSQDTQEFSKGDVTEK